MVKKNNYIVPSEKYSKEYLFAICGANEEKNALMVDSLRKNELPIIDHEVRILEIGPGSGESIRRLDSIIRESPLGYPVQLVSLDLFDNDELASRGPRVRMLEDCSHVVAGKAQKLPFGNETFSGINISAVLHEVYSYGGGLQEVRKALREMTRVLIPNGIVCYRDIFAPNRDFFQHSDQLYKNPTWVAFLKHFLPDFLTQSVTPYTNKQEAIRFYQSIDGDEKLREWKDVQTHLSVRVDAPLGLQREIQRHYLTLREFLVSCGVLGIKMTDPRWKGAIYANQPTVIRLIGQDKLAEQLLQAIGKRSKGTRGYETQGSLLFDKTIDVLMYRFFGDIDEGNEKAKEYFSTWQEREGKENYIYLGIADFLVEVARQSLLQSKREFVLLPAAPRDIKIVPRHSYQTYLSTVIETPFFEGKQMIKFKKYPMEDVGIMIENLISALRDYIWLGERKNEALSSLHMMLTESDRARK
ncbi:MAG: methyltransferase domain-containing protein [Candidatus Gottesmanbacteria bacterium]|nr:methyltransferase domain-containing protein [Candidatus Gottesmanbacteria bacterium]